MGSPLKPTSNDPQPQSKDKKAESWERQYRIYGYVLLGAAFVVLIFFLWKQNYCATSPIASDIWGQYGDFIGGVLGTIVAFVSLKYLIDTLKEQREANLKISQSNHDIQQNNERNSKTYELQQFDSVFQSLLSLYRESINDYHVDGKDRGRESLNAIFNGIYDDYKNTSNYPSKVKTATRFFDNLYVENRECMSVHLRMLYQLCRFISKSKIAADKKALYSKIVRSLLSEQELLMVRYNCMNPYGLKMQRYVNEFNLLKHLPLTKLLEFKEWNNIFSDSYKRNVLDTEFISLRKQIKGLFKTDESPQEFFQIQYSKRYVLVVFRSDDFKELTIELQRVLKQKGDKSLAGFEKAFDILTDNQIKQMLWAFLYEIIQYSNFGRYNHKDDLTYDQKVTSDGINSNIQVCVKKKTPLMIYYHQRPIA